MLSRDLNLEIYLNFHHDIQNFNLINFLKVKKVLADYKFDQQIQFSEDSLFSSEVGHQFRSNSSI